jgi:hypothetical protein
MSSINKQPSQADRVAKRLQNSGKSQAGYANESVKPDEVIQSGATDHARRTFTNIHANGFNGGTQTFQPGRRVDGQPAPAQSRKGNW